MSADCVLQGSGAARGYTLVYVPGRGKVYAHRLAWEKAYGPIPVGMRVCHTCDVRNCVNLEHLFLGTDSDNMQDMIAKGRRVKPHALKTHCKQGHEFTPENTYITKQGHRQCRACNRIHQRNRYAKVN